MLLGILFVRRELWTLHMFNTSMPHWQEGLLLPLSAIDGGLSGVIKEQSRAVQHSPAYAKFLTFFVPVFFVLYVACAALCERIGQCLFPAHGEIWRAAGLVLVVAGIVLRVWAHWIWTCGSVAGNLTAGKTDAANDGGTTAEPKLSQDEKSSATAGATKPQSDPSVDAVVLKIATTVKQGSAGSLAQSGSGAEGGITDAGTEGSGEIRLPVDGPYRVVRYPDASGKLLSLCGIPLCFSAWLPLLAMPGIIVLLKWHISDQESYRISQLGESYLAYKKRTWHFLPFLY